MNRIDVEYLSRADDGGNVEITLRGRRWSNTRGFVGEAHVQRIAIDVAVNGDRLDAHLLAGPDDATSNLAAIGDQDLLELARIKSHKKMRRKKAQKTQVVICAFGASLWLILDSEEWLALFNRLAVLNVSLYYFSTRLGLNLVHEFHGF